MDKEASRVFAQLCDLRSYSKDSILSSSLLQWLKYSAVNGCYTLISDSLGKARGYIVWADISKESARYILTTGNYPFYDYEWREGRILLLLDISYEPALRRKAQTTLRKLVKNRRLVMYKRNGKMQSRRIKKLNHANS